MEVPRLGVKSELLQLLAYATATAMKDPSHVCDLRTPAHGNTRSLTYWVRPEIKGVTSWILVGFISAAPQWELLAFLNIMKLLDHYWYIQRLTSSAFEPWSCKDFCSSSTCDCTSRSLWFTSLEIKSTLIFRVLAELLPSALGWGIRETVISKIKSHVIVMVAHFSGYFLHCLKFWWWHPKKCFDSTFCWAGIFMHIYLPEIYFEAYLLKWVLSIVLKDPWTQGTENVKRYNMR